MANIVFDFDGTLGDVKALMIEVANEISAKKGWKQIDDATFAKLSRGNIRDGFKSLGIPLREMPSLLIQARRILAERADEINLFEGIEQLIAGLDDSGHSMFILSTNSRKLIQSVLDRKNLSDKLVVLPSSGLFGKAPAIKKFMRSRKLNKKDVWYVGDELRDIEAAKKAGVNSIAVTWGLQHPDTLKAAKPTFVATSPGDIINYVS